MTTEAGVLFSDIRGFTRLSEQRDPEEVSALLRRFYAGAKRVLFPEAIIDKLIGDEVMALYLPIYGHLEETAPPVMLRHARGLLQAVGYGGEEEPFAEVGIGLDYGEAFVGTVGHGSVNDFTARQHRGPVAIKWASKLPPKRCVIALTTSCGGSKKARES